MKRRLIPDSEYKLVILYSLKQLGPVSSLQLLQFLVEESLMNYFNMQLNLPDLQEDGQVSERSTPSGPLLSVTAAGLYTLDNFNHLLPTEAREVIDQKAADWAIRFRAEQDTLAETVPLSDGSSCLRLRLLDGGTAALLDMLLIFRDETPPSGLQQRWRAAAAHYYEKLIRTLSEGFSESAAKECLLPASATLEAINDAEWLLSLNDKESKPTFTLLLTLPNPNMARYYAVRWPSVATQLKRSLLRSLRNDKH